MLRIFLSLITHDKGHGGLFTQEVTVASMYACSTGVRRVKFFLNICKSPMVTRIKMNCLRFQFKIRFPRISYILTNPRICYSFVLTETKACGTSFYHRQFESMIFEQDPFSITFSLVELFWFYVYALSTSISQRFGRNSWKSIIQSFPLVSEKGIQTD